MDTSGRLHKKYVITRDIPAELPPPNARALAHTFPLSSAEQTILGKACGSNILKQIKLREVYRGREADNRAETMYHLNIYLLVCLYILLTTIEERTS